MDAKTLERQALELSLAERAALAHQLLLSLETASEESAESAWLDEAQRRASALDSGAVRAVDAEDVDRRARLLLK